MEERELVEERETRDGEGSNRDVTRGRELWGE